MEHAEEERAERLARALEAASSDTAAPLAPDDPGDDIAALTRLARRLEQELPLVASVDEPDAAPRPAFLSHLRGELLAAAVPETVRRPTWPSWWRRAAAAVTAVAALAAVAIAGLEQGRLSPVARGPVPATATPGPMMGAARTMRTTRVSPPPPGATPNRDLQRPGGATPLPGGTAGPMSAAGIRPSGTVEAARVASGTASIQSTPPHPPGGVAALSGRAPPCPTATALPRKTRRAAGGGAHRPRASPTLPPRPVRRPVWRPTPGPTATARCSRP